MTTSSEYYSDSAATSCLITATAMAPAKGTALAKATYGQVWETWPFKKEYTGASLITAQAADEIIIVGSLVGKGMIARFAVSGSPLLYGTANSTKMTVNATSGVVKVSNPTGGMGQFKGLT
jgi:hypothetical protein